jgi:hypothetical protein
VELVPDPAVELNGVAMALPEAPEELASPRLYQLGYVAQLEALAADHHDGRPPAPSAAFGRYVLEVVCAAYRAAGTGGAEALPFAGPRDRTPLELWRAGAERDDTDTTDAAEHPDEADLG